MEERYLKVAEVAELQRLSKSLVYSLIARRVIPSVRVTEKRIVVKESDLKKWLDKRAGETWIQPAL